MPIAEGDVGRAKVQRNGAQVSIPARAYPGPAQAEALGLDHLTPRQVEVLRLVARGMTNAEVAQALFLSRRTVHAHLRTIYRKLQIGNRSAATRYAVQQGLI